MFCNGYRQDDIDINITNQNFNDNANMFMADDNMMGGTYAGGSMMAPIVEPGRERVVNRTFIHEVPQE